MPSFLNEVAATKPATLTEHSLLVGHLASGAPIVIPIIIARGRKPGPCLWVNGQVHGDELHGVFAAIDFVRGLSLDDLSGTVIVSSSANPLALDTRQRRTANDWLDLDQSFPGHREGSITERLASCLLDAVRAHADCLVSLHTTMASFDAAVFAAYKVPPKDSEASELFMLKCMAQFRPTFVCVMPDTARAGDTTGHTHGSIDYQLLLSGKPAFMIELGSGGHCDADIVRQGVEGLIGTAALLGLGGQPVAAANRLNLVRDFRSITTSRGGLFRSLARPGFEQLSAGQPYGRIIDLHGRPVEDALFDRPARLIAVRRDPVVHSGDRLAISAFDLEIVDLAN